MPCRVQTACVPFAVSSRSPSRPEPAAAGASSSATSSMIGSAFVDTNVLVYAEDHGEPEKRAIALKLLAEHIASDDLVLSAQVLSEFYVNVRRLRRPLDAAEALSALEQLAAFPVVPVTAELVMAAAAASERYKVSHWDALIL